jgi:DNA repair exonuclease SbcCD nuclease subunit
MSKFILLGDCHIGARGASPIVMEHQLQYFEEVFFPYMKKNGINTIIQLGDMFDTRKFSNHLVVYNWKKRFFDYMRDNDIQFVTLLGNHDTTHKNTNDINTTTLFLREYENITIIDTPTELEICKTNILLLPWICEDNRALVEERLANTNALYCCGHLEFPGFEVHAGQLSESGEDVKAFEKFDCVWTGHYHIKHQKDNIQYTGIPYELSWSEYGISTGFHVFDSKTHKIKYIKNIRHLFTKLAYDDLKQTDEYYKTIDLSDVRHSYVKLIVANKTDPYQFNKLVDAIVALEPIELKIMDELEDFSEIDLIEDFESEDTSAMIASFIEQTDTILDKEKLTSSLKSLYTEALTWQ